MKKSLSISNATRYRLISFVGAALMSDSVSFVRSNRDGLYVAKLRSLDALRQLGRIQLQDLVRSMVTDTNDTGLPGDLLAIGMLLREHGISFTESDFASADIFSRGYGILLDVADWDWVSPLAQ